MAQFPGLAVLAKMLRYACSSSFSSRSWLLLPDSWVRAAPVRWFLPLPPSAFRNSGSPQLASGNSQNRSRFQFAIDRMKWEASPRPRSDGPGAERILIWLEEEFHAQFDVARTPGTGDLGIAHLRARLPEVYCPGTSGVDGFPLGMVKGVEGIEADLKG
jgi:hypothetical protein